MHSECICSIVPADVLRRLSQDQSLPDKTRQALTRTALLDGSIRNLREQSRQLTITTRSLVPAFLAVAPAPTIQVYDCSHQGTMPGTPVANPSVAPDPSVKNAFSGASDVARFYQQQFARNSIDGSGATIVSSVHFGVNYSNAMWTGSQMCYGDGDGQIWLDLTGSDDVIGHELTHGVTQHSLQLAYADEAGGLNESISDVFGSLFRQWKANQSVFAADWLIGRDVMGPLAVAKGYICLRDMANPAAAHCLAPQPTHYSDFQPGMDPHYSSGICNLAFYTFAMAIAVPGFPNARPALSFSWQTAGQIWYRAMTDGGSSPQMTMHEFAGRTIAAASTLYPHDPAIGNALNSAWTKVGV